MADNEASTSASPPDPTVPDNEHDDSPFQAAPESYPDPPTIPPCETLYYEILGAEATCTQAQLKRKYFILARKYHPDKAQGDKEEAEEMFKSVSEAYDVLSDPERRLRYHRLGRKGVQDQGGGGFTDPRELFTMIFGGGKFGDIFGEMSFFSEESDEDMLAAFDKRRINLVVALRQRLRPFIKGNVAGFKKVAKAEAEKLRHESYGAEILRHVGYIYKSEAKKHLGGFKGWWAGVQANVSGKMEDLNILMIEAMMHEQIERMATLTPEERMEAEEEFVQQQLIAMWLRARYEMTIVVRHVCKEILRDEKLTKELRTRYAVGLRMLGEIWRSVEVPEYDLGDIPEEMGGGRGESAGNGRTFYENKVAKEASGFGDGAIVQYTEHASFRTAYAGK